MSPAVDNILAQALQIPAQDRAAIAERLISSLDTETDWDVEIAWQQEVQRRVDEVERGEVVCLPWEQVLQRLRKKFPCGKLRLIENAGMIRVLLE